MAATTSRACGASLSRPLSLKIDDIIDYMADSVMTCYIMSDKFTGISSIVCVDRERKVSYGCRRYAQPLRSLTVE